MLNLIATTAFNLFENNPEKIPAKSITLIDN